MIVKLELKIETDKTQPQVKKEIDEILKLSNYTYIYSLQFLESLSGKS